MIGDDQAPHQVGLRRQNARDEHAIINLKFKELHCVISFSSK